MNIYLMMMMMMMICQLELVDPGSEVQSHVEHR